MAEELLLPWGPIFTIGDSLWIYRDGGQWTEPLTYDAYSIYNLPGLPEEMFSSDAMAIGTFNVANEPTYYVPTEPTVAVDTAQTEVTSNISSNKEFVVIILIAVGLAIFLMRKS